MAFLTVKAFAARVGIPRITACRGVAAGRIPYVIISRRKLIEESYADEFLKGRMAASVARTITEDRARFSEPSIK